MELSVHGKQIDVGDALRGHVSDKLEDLNQKYFNHAAFATVTFSREGHGKPRTRAHISIQLGKNIMVVADAVEVDPYVSFENAAEKISKQMRRYKRRLRDHHDHIEKTDLTSVPARKMVLSAAPEQDTEAEAEAENPVVIAEMQTEILTLSVSDAVMRLDLSDQPALMFRNASNDEINMVYRRVDGNIGWVDPGTVK
jgi:ribosomal subunit interface protein